MITNSFKDIIQTYLNKSIFTMIEIKKKKENMFAILLLSSSKISNNHSSASNKNNILDSSRNTKINHDRIEILINALKLKIDKKINDINEIKKSKR
jgi:hypothetical protein